MALRQLSVLALGAMLLTIAEGAPRAQAWPAKPVRLIVPFAPGDAPDLSARLLAERMSGALGQQVVV